MNCSGFCRSAGSFASVFLFLLHLFTLGYWMKKTFIILRSVVLAVTGSKCDLMFAVVLLEENSSADHRGSLQSVCPEVQSLKNI